MLSPEPTILVVDDDDDFRCSLVDVLVGEGYAATGLPGGSEALDHLRTAPTLPALIVLDLMMPDMDGCAFRAEQLRDRRLAQAPVLMLTAGSPPPPSCAVPIFLSKLTSMETLLAQIRRLCGRSVLAAPSARS